MKTVILTLGIFAVLVGLIWVGQGTGYFPYPQSSFMISQIKWAYYGSGLTAFGLILIALSRRG
ncbi:MAG: hypothetical protein J0I29_14485 [Rhizobiales bacterium]|nr:hypothetical protein [Hyphomicrobiales bacterium]